MSWSQVHSSSRAFCCILQAITSSGDAKLTQTGCPPLHSVHVPLPLPLTYYEGYTDQLVDYSAINISGGKVDEISLVGLTTARAWFSGVLPFAKRGDDRGNNLIRLQQMFPRIVAAEFQQPLHVSPECQHLLSRMLTPDPARRVTIGEIMQHSWCECLPSSHSCVWHVWLPLSSSSRFLNACSSGSLDPLLSTAFMHRVP